MCHGPVGIERVWIVKSGKEPIHLALLRKKHGFNDVRQGEAIKMNHNWKEHVSVFTDTKRPDRHVKRLLAVLTEHLYPACIPDGHDI